MGVLEACPCGGLRLGLKMSRPARRWHSNGFRLCPLKWTWKKQSVEMNGDRNHDKNHDKKRQELGTCGSSARTMHVCACVCPQRRDGARPLVSCIEQDPHSKIHGMGSEFGYQNPHVCLIPCRIRSFHPLLSFFKNWPNADPSCG